MWCISIDRVIVKSEIGVNFSIVLSRLKVGISENILTYNEECCNQTIHVKKERKGYQISKNENERSIGHNGHLSIRNCTLMSCQRGCFKPSHACSFPTPLQKVSSSAATGINIHSVLYEFLKLKKWILISVLLNSLQQSNHYPCPLFNPNYPCPASFGSKAFIFCLKNL